VQGYARSHDDARRLLTALLAKADLGIPVASESWTVAEYLNYWLRHVVREDRRPKTYQGYEGVVRLHLIPAIGKKQLSKLNAQDVRVFMTRVREECQCCKHGLDADRSEAICCALALRQCCQARLSARMVQSIHAVLRNALECAVREEVIPRNVAKLVKIPVPTYKVNRRLTTIQARGVLRAAASHRLYALYVLALYLGLRAASCLACGGWTWILIGQRLRSSRRFSGLVASCAWCLLRPTTPLVPFLCQDRASRRFASTGRSNSLSVPTPGRTGRTMGWCSHRGAELRWSQTTCGGAGTSSGKMQGLVLHGFTTYGIPA
jgi:hypothetical protein